MASPDTSGRRYRAPRRMQQAQQTRTEILAAARRLFADRGWAATGMRDLAAAAGVSVETIYATLGAKPAVFAAALDGAVVGDDESVPLAERPEFLAIGRGGLPERVAAGVALILDIHRRANGLERALREAAPSEPALAELLTAAEERRRISSDEGLRLALGRTVSDAELDAFWVQTSPEVYAALTQHRGWTDQQYTAWITRLVLDMAPDAVPPQHHQQDSQEEP
jgi:AcrR family transcriptional regulator